MIRHCVFLKLRNDYDDTELQATLDGLNALTQRLDGASGFFAGPNRDYEAKSADYSAGFTIDFADKFALDTYADHPDHKALGARLVAQSAAE